MDCNHIIRNFKRIPKFSKLILWRLYLALLPTYKIHDKCNQIFIITTFRTGSNYLITNLNCHPDIFFIGKDAEVLRSEAYSDWYTMVYANAGKDRAIRHIQKTLLSSTHRLAGVKLMFEHLHRFNISAEDLKYNFPNAKYIILYRKSVLSQYISNIKASRTGQFTWSEGINMNSDIKITIDPSKFKEYYYNNMNNFQNFINHFQNNENLLILSYEEISDSFDVVLHNKIAPFLGIDYVATSTYLKKQSNKEPKEQISNTCELSDILSPRYYLNIE